MTWNGKTDNTNHQWSCQAFFASTPLARVVAVGGTDEDARLRFQTAPGTLYLSTCVVSDVQVCTVKARVHARGRLNASAHSQERKKVHFRPSTDG